MINVSSIHNRETSSLSFDSNEDIKASSRIKIITFFIVVGFFISNVNKIFYSLF